MIPFQPSSFSSPFLFPLSFLFSSARHLSLKSLKLKKKLKTQTKHPIYIKSLVTNQRNFYKTQILVYTHWKRTENHQGDPTATPRPQSPPMPPTSGFYPPLHMVQGISSPDSSPYAALFTNQNQGDGSSPRWNKQNPHNSSIADIFCPPAYLWRLLIHKLFDWAFACACVRAYFCVCIYPWGRT